MQTLNKTNWLFDNLCHRIYTGCLHNDTRQSEKTHTNKYELKVVHSLSVAEWPLRNVPQFKLSAPPQPQLAVQQTWHSVNGWGPQGDGSTCISSRITVKWGLTKFVKLGECWLHPVGSMFSCKHAVQLAFSASMLTSWNCFWITNRLTNHYLADISAIFPLAPTRP